MGSGSDSSSESALHRLAEHLVAIRTRDRYRPITVIAPSDVASLHLRRRLSQKIGGLFNIRFLTMDRLAELLGSSSVDAGTCRLSPSVEWEIARAATELDDLGTHQALVKLRRREAEVGQRGEGDPFGKWSERFEAFAASCYGMPELYGWAGGSVRNGAAKNELGSVVWFLPSKLPVFAEPFLDALFETGDFHVVASMVEGDDPVWKNRMASICAGPLEEVGLPTEVRFHVANEDEDEARWVVRQLIELRLKGVEADRIAVLAPSDQGAVALIADLLLESGIPFYCRPLKKLGDHPSARAVLGAMLAKRRNWRAADVAEWLSSADFSQAELWAGKASHIVRSSRARRDLAQWELKLEALALRSEGLAGTDWMADSSRAISSLLREVDLLLPDQASWAEWSKSLVAIQEKVRHPSDDEHFDSIRSTLEGLSRLDDVAPSPPTRARVELVVAQLFEGRGPRERKYGDGVFVGTLRDVSGLDFDHVFAFGLNSSALGKRKPGPMENDRSAQRLGEAEASRGLYRSGEATLRTAIATAPAATLSFARSCRLGGRVEQASEAFLSVLSSKVPKGEGPWYDSELTFGTLVTSAPEREARPISVRELGLKGLDLGANHGNDFVASYSLHEFDAFNGKVGELELLSASPSGLETYAECPRKWFLSRWLKVRETRSPSLEGVENDAFGTAVHLGLSTYFKQLMEGGPESTELAAQHVQTQLEQLALRGEAEDTVFYRDRCKKTLDAVRMYLKGQSFAGRIVGVEDDRTVEIRAGEGQAGSDAPLVHCHGIVDLVVEEAEEDRLHVIDFKTGRRNRYSGVDKKLQTELTRVQMPVYAWLVGTRDDQSCRATYVFLRSPDEKTEDFVMDPAMLADLKLRIGEMVRLIGEGVCPPVPEGNACKTCAYSGACSLRRSTRWKRLTTDPLVQNWRSVVRGVVDATEAEEEQS